MSDEWIQEMRDDKFWMERTNYEWTQWMKENKEWKDHTSYTSISDKYATSTEGNYMSTSDKHAVNIEDLPPDHDIIDILQHPQLNEEMINLREDDQLVIAQNNNDAIQEVVPATVTNSLSDVVVSSEWIQATTAHNIEGDLHLADDSNLLQHSQLNEEMINPRTDDQLLLVPSNDDIVHEAVPALEEDVMSMASPKMRKAVIEDDKRGEETTKTEDIEFVHAHEAVAALTEGIKDIINPKMRNANVEDRGGETVKTEEIEGIPAQKRIVKRKFESTRTSPPRTRSYSKNLGRAATGRQA